MTIEAIIIYLYLSIRQIRIWKISTLKRYYSSAIKEDKSFIVYYSFYLSLFVHIRISKVIDVLSSARSACLTDISNQWIGVHYYCVWLLYKENVNVWNFSLLYLQYQWSIKCQWHQSFFLRISIIELSLVYYSFFFFFLSNCYDW